MRARPRCVRERCQLVRRRDRRRRIDLVARLSGDEFAVVIPDLTHPEDADATARVLLGRCGAPLSIDGREIVVSCSIGVAIYPQHGETQEALLHAADTALYHAKEVRNSWQRYRPRCGSGGPPHRAVAPCARPSSRAGWPCTISRCSTSPARVRAGVPAWATDSGGNPGRVADAAPVLTGRDFSRRRTRTACSGRP